MVALALTADTVPTWQGLIPKVLCAVPQLSLCRTFCIFPEHSSKDAPATLVHISAERGVASPSPPTDHAGSSHMNSTG